MTITLKGRITPDQVDKKLLSRKPTKVINAKKHFGKVKWGEDALIYQKRIRKPTTHSI
jgi:hypothetical protein